MNRPYNIGEFFMRVRPLFLTRLNSHNTVFKTQMVTHSQSHCTDAFIELIYPIEGYKFNTVNTLPLFF